MTAPARALSWDVFCRVVDNYGDAAVCWRLARQLARGHGSVRLFIDELGALAALCPGVDAGAESQSVEGVDIRRWHEATDFGFPADLAVEGFGCGLPENYLAAKAQAAPGSLWIVLDYLSAEPWVEDRHGLPSPPPCLPLERHFFFPGFSPGTGGLLREADYASRARAFHDDPQSRAGFWRGRGFKLPEEQAAVVSLFAYENPAVASLLGVWAAGGRPVVAVVPRGRILPDVIGFLGAGDIRDGEAFHRGSLEVRFIPFLSQVCYDELLWACDWNFVRGEDSFVRAQWAAKPLVWQPYPQAENADRIKLEAFLDLYCTGLDAGIAAAMRTLWLGWSGFEPEAAAQVGEAWQYLDRQREQLDAHARTWAERLTNLGDLASNLANFCLERLK